MFRKMSAFQSLLIVLVLAFSPMSAADEVDNELQPPMIETPTVTFRGTWVDVKPYQLPDYKERVAAYTRIPYAEPPVGDLRFRRPVPKVVEGDFDATRAGIACAQVHSVSFELVEVSEDCLYLDIFVPDPKPSGAAVMVWIHGGGFQIGAGSIPSQLPIPLASMNDVIVVTFNYRLNYFGFLATGDEEIPANIGLLDQRQVLLWVQENIAAFGGDPTRVTIFGESAGGGAVNFLLASPMCNGLFSRAIMQSGVAGPKSYFPVEQTNKVALDIGKLMNCSTTSNSELAKCFREKSVEDFFNITMGMVEMMNLAPRPAVNDDFLPNPPFDFADVDYNPAEIMVGFNKEEGNAFIVPSMTGEEGSDKQVWDEATFQGTVAMLLETDDELVIDMASLIYAPTKTVADPEPNYADGGSALMGDLIFVCDGMTLINSMAESGRRVFAYILTHSPSASIWGKNATWLGPTHGEDLPYVLGSPFLVDVDDQDKDSLMEGRFNEQEVEMALQVMKYWTNFAKTGDPNLSTTEEEAVSKYPAWSTYTKEEGLFKDISLDFGNLSGHPRPKECEFLRGLLPKMVERSAEMARLKSILEEQVKEDSEKSCDDPESCP